MLERAVSCDCGHFRTTGNEYYPCPKCNSVCYNRKLQLKIGYFHEHYRNDRILLDFEQLHQSLAEHRAVEATFAQQLYRYRVDVYENITQLNVVSFPRSNNRVIVFSFSSILRAEIT